MSKFYAIRAYDQIFDGLHGMEDQNIIEADNYEEAEDVATEMSYEVMDSYSEIQIHFENSAEDEGFEKDTEEWDNYIEDLRCEDVAYDIYELKDLSSEDLKVLAQEFYDYPEEFLKKYEKTT